MKNTSVKKSGILVLPLKRPENFDSKEMEHSCATVCVATVGRQYSTEWGHMHVVLFAMSEKFRMYLFSYFQGGLLVAPCRALNPVLHNPY